MPRPPIIKSRTLWTCSTGPACSCVTGEFTIDLPHLCFGEARRAILAKCQPRHEANAIRRFLSWAQRAGNVTGADATATRLVLEKYESSVKLELDRLDSTFRRLANLPCIQVFGLDDSMLNRATELSLEGITLNPFDHAILAAILVRASRLWAAGERQISFCEMDADLQPWDKNGNVKPPLRDAFDQAHIWVYSDFTLTQPQRRPDFE